MRLFKMFIIFVQLIIIYTTNIMIKKLVNIFVINAMKRLGNLK